MTGQRFESATIVLGVTGSIAAYKAVGLARLMIKEGARVRVVLTRAGMKFVSSHTFAAVTAGEVYTDLFPEPPPHRPLHLDLAEQADLVVIAPCSADFLGRLAAGLADDLLAAVCLAATCPTVLAPAMHHQMWANRIVQANAERLSSLGIGIIGPERGELAAGDTGYGRMTEPEDIMIALRELGMGARTS